MGRPSPRACIAVLLLFAALAIPRGVAYAQSAKPGEAAASKAQLYKYLDALGGALEKIRETHVDEPDDHKLIEGAINGMLDSLGTYSSYYTAAELNAQNTSAQGEFGGIGVQVLEKDTGVEVIAPVDGTPADEAGLRAGDLITHVDDKPLAGLSLTQSVGLMRGKIGTDLKLTILRDEGAAPITVNLTRAKIVDTGVTSRAEGKAGYIRIAGFTDKSPAEFKKAVETLRKSIGNDLDGYIIDLRNCSGGLLIPATEIADALLDGGTIVSTKGRQDSINKTYEAKPGDITDGKRIVVLVNGGTASGAEVLAGALKDNGRATLLGSHTFGNGTVAEFIPIKDFGAMKVTNGRFHTPVGRPIEGLGLTPDIELNQAAPGSPADGAQGAMRYAYVPKDKAEDAQFQKALEVIADKETPPPVVKPPSDLTAEDLRSLD